MVTYRRQNIDDSAFLRFAPVYGCNLCELQKKNTSLSFTEVFTHRYMDIFAVRVLMEENSNADR